ncbi:NADH-quinone oxidoreductase subunit L [Arthrobacter castelli]|uniref:NADH-quinone oxidoreductase subunit 5 family protein n=1 Tax=Arthrobacter castelli TaxID=271431 RepID=UPI00041E29B5|nr:proton-conducting transporter membrane subunit [Arthrobacter castelli]
MNPGSLTTAGLAALVFVPAGLGTLLLLAGRRADRAAGPVALIASVLVVALAVLTAATGPDLSMPFIGMVEGGDFAVAVDGLSAVLIITVALVAAMVVLFAVVDLPRHAPRARFFGYLLLFTAAMLVTVTATTVPALLVAWEVMGATSYTLIGYWWNVPGKMAAGTKAFVTTRAGDIGLYVAAGAALAGTGTLAMDDLAAADGGWKHVAAAGILLAALGKSAQLPFSAWLSAAMEGPSPVSALLHSATMVAAGVYLLLRTQPLLESTGWSAETAAWVGAVTALVLGAVAAAQKDLKQLLAASTGAQIGFVVLAAGVGTTAGGTAQLVAHAGVKAGLFIAAGAWLSALGTKQLTGLRGAARRYRGIGAAGVIATVALAGVPPLSLWVTKDEVLAGVEGAPLHIVSLAAAGLAAVYAGKILIIILARPETAVGLDAEEPGTRTVPRPAAAAAAVLAVATIVLGALALHPVAEAAKVVLDAEGQPSPGWAGFLISGLLAVSVLVGTIALRSRLGGLERTPLARWAGLGHLLSASPWLAAGRAVTVIDERVIDRGVLAFAATVRRGAVVIGQADHRVIDGAVRTIGSATRRAGAAMRRPQTGLVHQYYLQAAIGFGALFLLLIVVR